MRKSEMFKTGYLVVLFMSHLNDRKSVMQVKKRNELFINN